MELDVYEICLNILAATFTEYLSRIYGDLSTWNYVKLLYPLRNTAKFENRTIYVLCYYK